MDWILQDLWVIPALPLLAAGLSAVAKQRHRKFAASLAVGSMVIASFLSSVALFNVLRHAGEGGDGRQVHNFPWFQFGGSWLELGWALDPLAAVMLVMISVVGLLIFIYSLSYMAHDENFTRFFCFLSLFAAAMLGLVIANSLLLLFICWEIVGLTSYLLIGFWHHKPSVAAAAKKAFIVTRIGDLAFLLGMIWLYSQAGTLLFYDGGNGCLEESALANLAAETTTLGIAASTGIALLIFCGAIGKSGQLPLHVWLPDAMEGPTPVSALIHAATMVAAGVFLVARVYPLMEAQGVFHIPPVASTAMVVVTWVGALTAVFAASVAVAQTDIKRILAYSTISQLGFMMLGLGVGGVAVGMFHLITHAFFKALLFLGAGSVIHGCRDEQDIRRMGGLRKVMPITFATYAVGMLALSGFPLVFSGFWSKDGILDAAHAWSLSRGPFYLGLFGSFLTAFYMTRQVCYVFFGAIRGSQRKEAPIPAISAKQVSNEPRESPALMTVPLIVLAVFSVLLGFIGTPAWPWFQSFLNAQSNALEFNQLFRPEILWLFALSSLLVIVGIGLGWWLYGRKPVARPEQPDILQRMMPDLFALLQNGCFVDGIYEWSVVRFNAWWARACDWLERRVWNGVVQSLSLGVVSLSRLNRFIDEHVINHGFDASCCDLTRSGRLLSRLQNGRVQNYLRVLGVALAALVLFLIWGWRVS